MQRPLSSAQAPASVGRPGLAWQTPVPRCAACGRALPPPARRRWAARRSARAVACSVPAPAGALSSEQAPARAAPGTADGGAGNGAQPGAGPWEAGPSEARGALLATLMVQCEDQKGVIAALAQLLYGLGCNIVASDQYVDPEARPAAGQAPSRSACGSTAAARGRLA